MVATRVVGLACVGLLCGLAAGPEGAAGQAPPAPVGSPAAGPATPPGSGALWVRGSVRVRVEGWDWFAPSAPASDDYAFGAGLLRSGIGMTRPGYEWQVELAAPVLLGLPTGAVAPAPQGQLGFGAAYRLPNGGRKVGLVPKQAYLQLRLGPAGAPSLRAGRFEFNDGQETQPSDPALAWLKRERIAQRLVGSFAFTHVGRSLDGLHFKLGSAGTDLTLVAARPTEGVFQLDGLGELDIELAYAALTRALLPAGGKDGPQPTAEARLFALYYQDRRDVPKVDNRPAEVRSADGGRIRLATLGANYLQTRRLGPGKADLLLWGALQVGGWGADRHRAHAYAAELGYRTDLPASPWLRIGYFRGSGDGAADDGTHGTFFQVLPTPRLFARFPFYNLMNVEDGFVELHATPLARLTLRGSAHAVGLAAAGDLWYAGGGAFGATSFGFVGRPTGGRRDLARLVDLSLDCQVSPRLGVTLYAGRALGEEAIETIHPGGPNGTFGYLEVTRRF